MRWTIAKKLGFGFGFMIVLIIGVAAVVNFKLGTVNRVQTCVLDDRQPAATAAAGVLNGINDSLANLRGYIILGKDKFKDGRLNSWKSIDENVQSLVTLSKGWTDSKDVELVGELKTVLEEFRVAQQTIEDDSRPRKTHRR